MTDTPDRRDKLMTAMDPLMHARDWSGRECQASIKKTLATIFNQLNPRSRSYFLRNIIDDRFVKPDLTEVQHHRRQAFYSAIIRLKMAGAGLPEEHRGFVNDLAKRCKWQNWTPTEKQMEYALSLDADWGVTAEIDVLEQSQEKADG